MSSSIFTLAWVKGAGERALKSGVQGGIAGLGLSVTAAVTPGELPGVLDLPWGAALSGFVVMALLSIATSVTSPDFTAGVPTEPPTDVDRSAGDIAVDEDPDLIEELDAEEEELPMAEEPVEEAPSEAGLATGAQHAADAEERA